jgi:hypothetical protein
MFVKTSRLAIRPSHPIDHPITGPGLGFFAAAMARGAESGSAAAQITAKLHGRGNLGGIVARCSREALG